MRSGAVIDLQINQGEVIAQVQGSQSQPYKITIKIKTINKNTWKNISNECAGKLESLQELIEGRFPKALEELFAMKGYGLFPSPEEIDFDCSCPDGAYMCKHVAASLYGTGTRLDEDPKLFFVLRKVGMNDLISKAVTDKSKKMIKKAEKKTSRVMADENIGNVFGIDLEMGKQMIKLKRKGKK